MEMIVPFATQPSGRMVTTLLSICQHPVDFGKKTQPRTIQTSTGDPFSISLTLSTQELQSCAPALAIPVASESHILASEAFEDLNARRIVSSSEAELDVQESVESTSSIEHRITTDTEDVKTVEKSGRIPKHSQNKSRVPWNKGRKHSEETRELIRIRTRQAMEDAKVRERLRLKASGSTQSSETKLKIKRSIKNLWAAKRIQESCLLEWKEAIAEAARIGSDGDSVYQWDSFKIIMSELRNSWNMEKRMERRLVLTSTKSAEHRSKISNSIKAKWADPDYRDKVLLAARNSKKQSKKSQADAPKRKQKRVGRCQEYKDPLIKKKLEKLKKMRASRLYVDNIEESKLIKHARALIKEANRAVDALEEVALADRNAIAPLLEARQLLAEAAHAVEAAELRRNTTKSKVTGGTQGNFGS